MMSGQQFNLRWNNHTNNILQVFMDHLNSELLVDVSLSCEGKFIKAHKMVLSACSPYFQDLFKVHNQFSHPVIVFNGINYDDLKLVIEFMYRGEIKVQENDLQSVLQTAETLQIKGLSTVRNKYDEAAAAAAIKQQLLHQGKVSPGTTSVNNSNCVANNSSTSITTSPSPTKMHNKRCVDPFKTRQRVHHKKMQKDGNDSSLAMDVKLSHNPDDDDVSDMKSQQKVGVTSPPPPPLPRLTPKTVRLFMNKQVADEDDNDPDDCGNNESSSNYEDNGVHDDDKIDDDDLPATIKVEPPDIRDIDGDGEEEEEEENEEEATSNHEMEYDNSSSPKLIIDMGQTTDDHCLLSSRENIHKATLPTTIRVKKKMFKPQQWREKLSVKDDSAVGTSINPKIQLNYKKQYNWFMSGGKIPRPPNAFMIFANEWRRKLAYEHPLESNKDISVRLGMMWKNLTVDAKEGYYKASRQADEDHKRKYPGYYYSPKEARLRKNMKLKSRITLNSSSATITNIDNNSISNSRNNNDNDDGGNDRSSTNVDALTFVKVFMTKQKSEKAPARAALVVSGDQPKWRKVILKKNPRPIAIVGDVESTVSSSDNQQTLSNELNPTGKVKKHDDTSTSDTNSLPNVCVIYDDPLKDCDIKTEQYDPDDDGCASERSNEQEDCDDNEQYNKNSSKKDNTLGSLIHCRKVNRNASFNFDEQNNGHSSDN